MRKLTGYALPSNISRLAGIFALSLFVLTAFGQETRGVTTGEKPASGPENHHSIAPKVMTVSGTHLAPDQLPATIPGAILPTPTSSSLGGVQAFTAPAHQWINSISTSGNEVSSQPSSSDLSDAANLIRTNNTNTYSADQFFQSGRPWFDIQAFGAKGDGQQITDAVTNGTTTLTTVSSALFAPGDVGKSVIVLGGAGNGTNLVTTVAGYTSNSQITLASASTLTIPVVFYNFGNCATYPYGYATVGSNGQVSSVTVAGNGTSGCSGSPTAALAYQQGQSGSGAVISVSVTGGVISASVTNGGSGYHATVLWGTADQTAITSAYSAACTAGGGTVYVPIAHKSFYLMTGTVSFSTCGNIVLAGAGPQSFLEGDPGNHEILVVQSAAPYTRITGLQVANVHTPALTAPTQAFYPQGDTQWFGIHCAECTHLRIDNNLVTAGNDGIQIDGGSSYVDVGPNNTFSHVSTVAVNAGGATNQINSDVHVFNNTIGGTVYMNMNGYGHDINLEDVTRAQVLENNITNVAGPYSSNAIQVANTHYTLGISDILIEGNHLYLSNPSPTNALGCIYGSVYTTGTSAFVKNYVLQGNSCDGYAVGFSFAGINSGGSIPYQVTGLLVSSNTFNNLEGTNSNGACIYITSGQNTAQGIKLIGNTCNGIAGITSAGAGFQINKVSGLDITGNTISYMPQYGISLGGVTNSSVTGNIIRNNSQASPGTYGGISLSTFGIGSSNNVIANNQIYDDQSTKTQKYGIVLNSATLSNRVSGNYFGAGNLTANVDDAGSCNYYGSVVGCNDQSSTLTTSLPAQTLVPASTYNVVPQSFKISIYAVCTGTAGATLGLTLNYTDPLAAQTATNSIPCVGTALPTSLEIPIRSTGAAAITYSTTASASPAPSYRIWVRAEEQ